MTFGGTLGFALLLASLAGSQAWAQQPPRNSHHAPHRPAAQPAPVQMVVVYASTPPTAAFAVEAAHGVREVIHGQANARCRRMPMGESCALLMEAPQPCGALAHATQDPRLIPFGAPPPGLPVQGVGAGSGFTTAEAEQNAIAACQARRTRGACRVVAAACAP